ncbi:hypothetical protein [Halosegnis longus]|uniref:Uncharacterized protein n=1 Tax=Halosegnis longus TaxID=2216012 RepID=A0AAJ4UWD2_9EURY|nr:hypothetical protein [Halosegnis longus]RNJ26810.1 hypothetical protein Nmn1133_09045 [Salella cibi]
MDTPQRSVLDRRTVLKSAAGVFVAAGTGVGAIAASSQSAVAGEFTAADTSTSSNDGTLTTLEIAPEFTIDWDGQESDVAEIEYVVTASTDVNSQSSTATGQAIQTTKAVSTPGKTGSVTHTLDTAGLLSNNGGMLNGGNFDANTDGGDNSRTVELTVDVTLFDGQSNQLATKPGMFQTTFVVTVSNVASSTSGSGTANTTSS